MARTETIEPTTATDTSWLQALEEKVHTAARRIRELKEENATLHRRVEELEQRLAEAPASDDAAARWAEEREEIRGRVARLVEHLDGLLEEA